MYPMSHIPRHHSVRRISLLNRIPVRRRASRRRLTHASLMTMMPVDSRVAIGSPMAIAVTTDVHGKTGMRLDNLVVAGDLVNGLCTVGVMASFSVAMLVLWIRGRY